MVAEGVTRVLRAVFTLFTLMVRGRCGVSGRPCNALGLVATAGVDVEKARWDAILDAVCASIRSGVDRVDRRCCLLV